MESILSIKKTTLLFFLIALLGLAEKGTAQPYQSFFGEHSTTYSIFRIYTSKKSTPSQSNFGEKSDILKSDIRIGIGLTNSYTLNADDTITIEDKLYFIPTGDYVEIDMFIREDTNTGQLFRYTNGTEHLICDMSLAVGDTYTFPYFCDASSAPWYLCSYSEEKVSVAVDSISYIDGRKIIYFQNIPDWRSWLYGGSYPDVFNFCFMEGIGPIYGPFGHIASSGTEPFLGLLLCVEKDDTLAYMTNSQLGCYHAEASISEAQINSLKIYPNPVADKLKIEISDPNLLFGKIVMMDVLGREVYLRESFSVSDEIAVSHLPSGVYILQYVVKDKVYQSKFIKQ